MFTPTSSKHYHSSSASKISGQQFSTGDLSYKRTHHGLKSPLTDTESESETEMIGSEEVRKKLIFKSSKHMKEKSKMSPFKSLLTGDRGKSHEVTPALGSSIKEVFNLRLEDFDL